ncbi:MAG: hypothetical protein M3365_00700 [Gemmatimonadota bacterium]|nr:hypothetical protein [Gemmatimonadota bacterium]
MVLALGDGDSVGIVLPQATDSSMPMEELPALPSDLIVDLIGRAGRIASGVVVSPVTRATGTGECRSWPMGRTQPARSGWRIGFPAGRVSAIPLDSIEGMSSADSASLANAITQNVAALPSTSDSDFRDLPFRVRSAHTFRTDSIAGVIADVVRSVNEEANPRLEHFFVIGERPIRSTSNYRIAFFSRTAGAEEAAEITELLAVVLIGAVKRPVAVVNIEYDEGGKLGLLERTGPGQWRFRWRSAYTGC